MVSHHYRTATLVLLTAFVTYFTTLAINAGATTQAQDGEIEPAAMNLPDPTAGPHEYSVVACQTGKRGENEVLCVFRHSDEKLAIYDPGNSAMTLLAVRNLSHDLAVPNAYSKSPQVPTVRQMQEWLRENKKPNKTKLTTP